MTQEVIILQELRQMAGAIGRIEGNVEGVRRAQAEMKLDIVQLFELHRDCEGPHVGRRVDDLRAELKELRDKTTSTKLRTASDDKISRIPPPAGKMSEKTIQYIILAILAILAAAGVTVPNL